VVIALCEPSIDFRKALCKPVGDDSPCLPSRRGRLISVITPAGASESMEVGHMVGTMVYSVSRIARVKVSSLLALVQGEGMRCENDLPAVLRGVANESKPFRRMLNR
jgi:hypothetical protein